MSEEEQLQIHDVGQEGAPEPSVSERAEPDELRVPDDLEAYFNRVEAEKGERAAVEAALAVAERMAREQGDRSMHVADSSRETVNGAISRIGGDLSQGKDAREVLDDVKKQIIRLETEERAALVALRAELPPAGAPVVAEEPAEAAAPEREDASPSDAWSDDERRDVSAYLDSIDATDKAHAAYMKSVREMKKIDKASPEWSKKAAEVNGLEQTWKNAKATSRAKEDALGARAGELTALDVGRKAGRDALRARMEAMPQTVSEPAMEPSTNTTVEKPTPTEVVAEPVELKTIHKEQSDGERGVEQAGARLEADLSGVNALLLGDSSLDDLGFLEQTLREQLDAAPSSKPELEQMYRTEMTARTDRLNELLASLQNAIRETQSVRAARTESELQRTVDSIDEVMREVADKADALSDVTATVFEGAIAHWTEGGKNEAIRETANDIRTSTDAAVARITKAVERWRETKARAEDAPKPKRRTSDRPAEQNASFVAETPAVPKAEAPEAPENVPLIHVRDYLPTAAQWKSEESSVRDMTADELLERVQRSERNYQDSVLDASRRPDTVEEQERNELSYWKWKNEAWRELADRKRAAEAAHVSMQEGLATRTPEKMREDAAEDIRWSDAVITGLNEALQEREFSGFNSLTPTSGEMIADIPVDSPLTTPRGEEPPPTPERGVRAKIDAYRMLVDVMAQTDPYRRPENGTLRDDPDSLMRLVRVFQEAPQLLRTIPDADAPHLARALREVAFARGVQGADAMSDASIRSWAERLTEDTTYALNEKAEKMYSW